MAFLTTVLFVLAAGIVFVTINVMTPFLYDLWYNELRAQSDSSLTSAGDNAFSAWQVMSYVVPGIIIIYGVAYANRKSVSESELY